MENPNNRIAEEGIPEERSEASVPEEANLTSAQAPAEPPMPEVDAARYAQPEIDSDDEDDTPTEWVPSRFEKRIHAIPEKQWVLYQTLAGIAIGAFTVFALFFGGEGLSPMFIVALVLALLAPNMLEDRGRRKLNRLRITMVIVLAVGIVGMAIYLGATRGWSFFSRKEAEAAIRRMGFFRI
ncbi:MAG: hypothetical protein IKD53_05525 [Clostridia bacterium]|nr:hypothetical protein [Clostridia bacterium]